MPLFILMIFTLTFAGHLLWSSGILNQVAQYLMEFKARGL